MSVSVMMTNFNPLPVVPTVTLTTTAPNAERCPVCDGELLFPRYGRRGCVNCQLEFTPANLTLARRTATAAINEAYERGLKDATTAEITLADARVAEAVKPWRERLNKLAGRQRPCGTKSCAHGNGMECGETLLHYEECPRYSRALLDNKPRKTYQDREGLREMEDDHGDN